MEIDFLHWSAYIGRVNVRPQELTLVAEDSPETMDKENLKNLLASLHQELEGADRIDGETRALVEQLHTDIEKLGSPPGNAASSAEQEANVLQQAESLEVRFAAKHPTAEGLVREIIDILGRMGI